MIAVHGEQIGVETRWPVEEDFGPRAETSVGSEEAHQGQEQLQAQRGAEEGPTGGRITPLWYSLNAVVLSNLL